MKPKWPFPLRSLSSLFPLSSLSRLSSLSLLYPLISNKADPIRPAFIIGSLIENEMRVSGKSYADFPLALLNTAGAVVDSCIIHVLYCDRFTVCTDTDIFLAENFLTTLQYRRIAPGDTTSLFFFTNSSDSIQASVPVRFRRVGSDVLLPPAHFTLNRGQTASDTGVVQLNISQSYFIEQFASSQVTKRFEWEIATLTVNVGQRSATFYVDRSLDAMADAFAFRNVFNVWDSAILPRTTKTKTDVERSTAVVNTRSQFYNQRVTQTFEVETGPLTSDEAEWLDQLFTSASVMRIESNACDENEPFLLVPILITDSDCEVSDTDESSACRFACEEPQLR